MSKTKKTPKKESDRVIRGSCCDGDPQYARVADRLNAFFTDGIILGVRLVEVLDETSNADRKTQSETQAQK